MGKEEMKQGMDVAAKAKKTVYSLDITRHVDRGNVIMDGGTRAAAEDLKGRWIRLNSDGLYLYEEGNEIITVEIRADQAGCSCDKFASHDTNVVCKHLVALLQKEKDHQMPQLLIESDSCRIIQGDLMSFEPPWTVKDRMFYPPNTGELPPDEDSTTEPEVVAELSPLDEEAEDVKSDETDPPTEEPKVITRTCDYCGYVATGTDATKVKADIADHRDNCSENPKNKVSDVPKPKEPEPEAPTPEPTEPKPKAEEMRSAKCQFCGRILKRKLEADLQKAIEAHEQTCPDRPKEPPRENASPKSDEQKVSLYDWIENLVEFGVGQFFGDTGVAKTGLCRAIAENAADEGKKVVYWDTEGNMTRKQRKAMSEHKNITYIINRDWNHIKNMLNSELSKGSPKLGKCDLFILDSIGVPVLGIYGTLKQNQKGNALQAMQGLLYELTKFAETNDAVVLVTNQPVSEMNKTEEQKANRHPFGDKAMFFTKEILKLIVAERTEYKTVCHVLAWRSRSAGRNRHLCTVTISDAGVEVVPVR